MLTAEITILPYFPLRFGNTFYVGNAGDVWIPPFPLPDGMDYRDVVKNVRDMELRDSDVLVVSYPKTGDLFFIKFKIIIV